MQTVGYGEAPLYCTIYFLKHVRRQAPAGWSHPEHHHFATERQRLCDVFNHRAIGPKAQHIATVLTVAMPIDTPDYGIGGESQHSVSHLAVAAGNLVIKMNNQ